MNKVGPNTKSESGVTLIALLVMIILMVILAAVTVRALTGNESLLSVAGEAVDDYKIKTMKENLSTVIRKEMIAKATLRESSNTSET